MTDPASRLAAHHEETTRRVAALTRRLADIIDSSTHTTNDDEHDPEGVTVAFERAQVAALLDQAKAELTALTEATTRLGDGTYGTCTRCGSPIAPARLEALPTATRCIHCADLR